MADLIVSPPPSVSMATNTSPAPPAAPGAAVPPPYGPPITLAQAKRVMAAAEAAALEHGWPMAIAIVDSTGHLVLFHR